MKTPISREVESRTQTVCLMTLVAIAGGAALYWLRPVLLPFVLAVFFVSGVAPILDYIEDRLKAPRIIAVVITFLLGLVIAAILWTMIWLSVATLIRDADTYRSRLRSLIAKTSMQLGLESKGDSADDDNDSPSLPGEREVDALAEYASRHARVWLGQLSTALTDLLSNAMMVLIFMFFLLLGGSSSSIPRRGVWRQIESQIRNYIVAKTAISLVTGGIFGAVLWMFDVPLALVFGVLAFLLNFIPNVGPIIASLLPIPLIVLSPDLSVGGMVLVTALAVGIQFVSGNVIEPKIMGDSFELHPVAILLTLMLWGMLWGMVGMFLATPMTAAIKILLDKFEPTKPVADALAGNFRSLHGRG